MRTLISAAVVLGVLATGAYLNSPAVRAAVGETMGRLTGWTPSARDAEKAGFARHAKSRMEQQLAEFSSVRRTLVAELGDLAREEQKQQGMRQGADVLAREFRVAYQHDDFPVVLRGVAYDREKLEAQVGGLLAEAAGCDANLAAIRQVRERTQKELQRLNVQINETEARLAVLSAQRGLLEAQELTDEGDELMAAVEDLLDENDRVLAENPIRSVRELLAASETSEEDTIARQQVRDFLAVRDADATIEEPAEEATGDKIDLPISESEQPVREVGASPVTASGQIAADEAENVVENEPAGQDFAAKPKKEDEKKKPIYSQF